MAKKAKDEITDGRINNGGAREGAGRGRVIPEGEKVRRTVDMDQDLFDWINEKDLNLSRFFYEAALKERQRIERKDNKKATA